MRTIYFVADVDNFSGPATLRELVALTCRSSARCCVIAPGDFYSNYHAEVDANGYYQGCDQYHWILNRWIRGVDKRFRSCTRPISCAPTRFPN